MSTIWDTDWDNMWYSQLLSWKEVTPTPVVYELAILKIWEIDCNNGLPISQEKSFEKSNTNLFCSYSIISSLFRQFSLVIEYDKLEVFHFSRLSKY